MTFSFSASVDGSMIQGKESLRYYDDSDRRSNGYAITRPRLFRDGQWRLVRALRRAEFWENCRRSFFWVPIKMLYRLRFHRLCVRLRVEIPPNVFGPGLCMIHPSSVFISKGVRVGSNCRLHNCVNIGAGANIGDNVFIGPHVSIYGDIEIASNIVIGANSVVNKSFLEENVLIAGSPAKQICSKSSNGLMIRGVGPCSDDPSDRQSTRSE